MEEEVQVGPARGRGRGGRGTRGRGRGLPEGGARNIKLTDDIQAFIKEEQKSYTTAFHHHRRSWSGSVH